MEIINKKNNRASVENGRKRKRQRFSSMQQNQTAAAARAINRNSLSDEEQYEYFRDNYLLTLCHFIRGLIDFP